MNVAALRISSHLPRAFRILPVGRFRACDGRKDGDWVLPVERGRQIAALARQKVEGFLIDYEHESLKRQDAPEAGRFRSLEWRDDGLYVTDATWSDEAKRMIAADKKRFISPVFRYDAQTKEVLSLESIALTADPALLGLTDLSQVAVATAQPLPGVQMSAREREVFERAFGHAPEQLAALYAERSAPSKPDGISESEWNNFRHVFGDEVAALASKG